MKKPAIPNIPAMADAPLRKILLAVKENLETLEGRRGQIELLETAERTISGLPMGAVNSGLPAGDFPASSRKLDEVIAKVNELLNRLQD